MQKSEGSHCNRVSAVPSKVKAASSGPQKHLLVVGVIFLLLVGAYHSIFATYFPLPNGLMGHDYALAIPGFLDGYLWYRNNGIFTPPWFTPSYCAGQALFADPQSGFYSIPQFLSFVTDPLTATYASMLLFASLGFWGMYVFSRRSVGISVASALVAGVTFMFNGFLSHRMIVGHLGYQSFMLVPWLAWLLCLSPGQLRPKLSSLAPTLATGFSIAYWLHGGLTTLMIPAAMSVLTLACVCEMRSPGTLHRVFLRGIAATGIALALCASKLVAGIALMSNFPRTYYPLPGISDPVGLLKFVMHALFYSSQHAYETVTPLWKNLQWSAMPHELAFGVTIIPLMIILVAVLLGAVNAIRKPFAWPNPIPIILLAVILITPLALLYYTPEWNALIKKIPVFGSTTSPARWLVIYLPIIALAAGIATDSLQRPKWVAVIALIGIPALNALENRDFYAAQNYDPSLVLDFDRSVRQGMVEPKITAIEVARTEAGQIIIDNTAFTRGVTSLFCYNPLFGYRLENYHAEPLRPGSITDISSPGHLNLRNPACLLYPAENQCSLWDSFREDQKTEMQQFASYRSFNFQQSTRQELANALSIITLLASIATAIALFALSIFDRMRQ